MDLFPKAFIGNPYSSSESNGSAQAVGSLDYILSSKLAHDFDLDEFDDEDIQLYDEESSFMDMSSLSPHEENAINGDDESSSFSLATATSGIADNSTESQLVNSHLGVMTPSPPP